MSTTEKFLSFLLLVALIVVVLVGAYVAVNSGTEGGTFVYNLTQTMANYKP